jgi:thiamine-monophosphate kinase
MDEYGIIETMIRAAEKLPKGYSQIGDDVAVIPLSRGSLVVKCDMLVSKTDVPLQMTHRQAARKAVAMCVSDFAAKGVEPQSFLVSLGLPRGFPDEAVAQLSQGFKDASSEWNLKLVGGDTNEASDLIVDCVMLGFSKSVVSRRGAKAGQYVVVSGYFGYPTSGLKIMDGASADPAFKKKAVRSVLEPKPRLELGVALSKYLSSSIDSSDGLAICLHTIATMSGVGIMVRELPCRDELVKFAERNGLSFEELVLYGGEEYEIVGTVEKRLIGKATQAAKSLGSELVVVGETTDRKGEVEMLGGREIEKRGWIHLTQAMKRSSPSSRIS